MVKKGDKSWLFLALVVYEYLITFDREIAVVWNRRWTATSALLVFVRWTMVLGQLAGWLGVRPDVCTILISKDAPLTCRCPSRCMCRLYID